LKFVRVEVRNVTDDSALGLTNPIWFLWRDMDSKIRRNYKTGKNCTRMTGYVRRWAVMFMIFVLEITNVNFILIHFMTTFIHE
jgi:hypothetical protein